MDSVNQTSNSSLDPTFCQDLYATNLGQESHTVVYFLKMLIGIIGVLGNYLVIIVYKRKREIHPSELLILAIAVIDLSVSLLNVWFLLFIGMSVPLGYSRWTGACLFVGCFVNSSSYTFTTFSSLFMVTVITVNRYVAICRPLDYSTWFSGTKVKWMIAAAFSFGLGSCVSPGVYCYSSAEAAIVADAYWYGTKMAVTLANCLLMVFVYVLVINKFSAQPDTPSAPATHLPTSNGDAVEYHKVPPGGAAVNGEREKNSLLHPPDEGVHAASTNSFRSCSATCNTASSTAAVASRTRPGNLSRERHVTLTLFAISVLYIAANLCSTIAETVNWYFGDVLERPIHIISEIWVVGYMLHLLYFDMNPFIYYASNSYYRARVKELLNNPRKLLPL